MANFKRRKTKPKSYDGDGFNKTKDKEAIAAGKGKGAPRGKVKKPFGLEVTDTYKRHDVQYCNQWLNRPLVMRMWYRSERERANAAKAYEKNIPTYWFAIVTRTIKQIER